MTTSPSSRNDHTTARAGWATWAIPIVPIWIDFCAKTFRPCAATPLVKVRISMYVQPVPLSPNTSPWAIASGSTATAAIGQIVAMKVVTSMSRRKCLVDTTYATRSSIAITPNTFPSSDASPLAGALSKHEGHAAERERRRTAAPADGCTR